MREYRAANRRKVLFILLFVLMAVAAFFVTLGFGVFDISVPDAIRVFFDNLTGNSSGSMADHYIWDERTPRAIGALIIGAGLSVAGVIMQNDFKNPLADPYTMGISSGAFLGATLSIVFGFSVIPGLTSLGVTAVNAFIFSLIPTAIIVLVSKYRRMSPSAMILTGIAVMFLFSSVTQIIMVTAPSESMADAYSWRVGTLSAVGWENLPIMLGTAAVIITVLWLMSDRLNVMYAGDRAAQTLGESAGRLRLVTLVLASLLTAGMICFTGTIGFIGLVGPHVARIFVGSNNRYLIPASAAFGAAFVLFADTVAKVSGPNGLPVGVICSMIGGPLFVYILVKQRKRTWM
ncbi:MAG: iron ABC transporter permease [Thermoplasmata archaeon]|nr:iron ABC transporter permease [Thermoplasmata archaeon]